MRKAILLGLLVLLLLVQVVKADTNTTTSLPENTTSTTTVSTTTTINATTTSTTTVSTTTIPVDTKAPGVGSVSPISVTPGQSTTFVASVNDDVGVTACNFSSNEVTHLASVSGSAASYTTTLSEGSYSVYFKCRDAAGNVGSGSTITVTASKSQLSVSVTLPKTTYYPAESFEPRATVKAPDGRVLTDATVTGTLNYGTKSDAVSFFYSTLCDCYKLHYWIGEGALPNDYTLTVTAKHSSYSQASSSASFTLIKPTLQLTMSTDKTEYNAGDSIKVTITVKDILGNVITSPRLTGEIKDAATGSLITTLHPWLKDNLYYCDYYVGPESVGKNYDISISASWKEQSASSSKRVLITKRGINGDVMLEKDVLMPGDMLRGKVKVFDKDGLIVTDAKVEAEVKGVNDKPFGWMSTKYRDGFYEIEGWRIEDWTSVGNYTLSVRIEKGSESIFLTRDIEITKQKLNVRVVFDQTSYAPGDRIYMKIIITHPNGSVVPNVQIGGEIFPLTYEVLNETAGITGEAILITGGATLPFFGENEPSYAERPRDQPLVCRVYVSPVAPIYYKGEYIPPYYVDDNYIPNWCQPGRYALRLRISAPGYAETEYTKEFEVAAFKLLLETGFKIFGRQNTLELGIYAEVKDEHGALIPFASVMGYLHPIEEKAGEPFGRCVKKIYLNYDEFATRYITRTSLSNSECPAGEYLLEIVASRPSYAPATVKQSIRIEYSEGFEYNVVVSSAVATPVCKEVSCGPNCINKVCEPTVTPQECYEEVVDKDCARSCIDKATTAEQSAVEFDVKNCVNNCAKKVQCKGYAVSTTQSQDMLNKLDQIQAQVQRTGEQVNVIEQLVRSIITFINSIVALFGGGQVRPINVTTT